MTDDLRSQLERALDGLYSFERELGGGGMSRVFVAEETSLGRKVVVKVLPPHLAATVNLERFRREIQLAAQLQHPHIVPLLSAGIVDGLPYYTMPFVEGETLRERLSRQGELPVSDALRILRDVTSALSYAHEHGVVHRDIKPENVLLTKHHALVADFGVAKALSASADEGSSLTSLGIALGTPAYMAPEQAAADPATDHRADIYAVGALAYELLTGRQVFGDRSPQAMLHAHLVEQPMPIEVHRPSVPSAVAAFIMNMLEKHPADRPQSADEMLQALDGLARTPSGGLTPAGMSPTQRVPVVAWAARRSRSLVAAALAGAGILAAAGMLARDRFGGPALDRARVVVPAFENRTGDPRYDELGALVADWITRSLTQSGLAEVAVIDSVSGELGARATAFNAEELRAIARSVGAGSLLRGSVGRRGDSLEFAVTIVEVKDGRTVSVARPVVASATEPMSGVEQLRQQTMGALATLLNPGIGTQASEVPPNYEAYMEFMRGETEFQRSRYSAAAEHYRRASDLDSTYAAPVIGAAYAHSYIGSCAQTDSLAGALHRGSYNLSEYERHNLAKIVAWCQRDWNSAYRAAKNMLAVAPRSTFAQYGAAQAAMPINRLREAKTGLERLWPNRFPVIYYYENLAAVYHTLGEHRNERRVVRLAQEMFPDLPLVLLMEARLEAVSGDSAAIERVLLAMQSRHHPPEYHAGIDIWATAGELATHGHAEPARRVFEQLYQWLRRRPAREARAGAFRHMSAHVAAITGRCPEATVTADTLSQTNSSLRSVAVQGFVAAHCGDTVRADSISSRLADWEDIYGKGDNTLARAQIAAILGQKQEAVNLLLDAFSEGRTYSRHYHASGLFAALRDYPPFKALLASRD